MSYGLPYKGSKNAIAARIVSFLPPGRRFCDLFCGGCAMTHAAMLSGKWERFLARDIAPALPRFFQDAASGKYLDEKRWISREDFARLWQSDPFVSLCWSFGSKGDSYIYGIDIEWWMRALHHAIVMRDYAPIEEDFGVRLGESDRALLESLGERSAIVFLQNRLDMGRLSSMLAKTTWRTLKMEHRVRLARVNALAQSLPGPLPLVAEGGDYREYRHEDGDVVYCDPPYIGTSAYSTAFDHAEFYGWLRSRPYPVYVSEYRMPDDFVPVFAVRKRQLLAQVNCAFAVEKVFLHRRFAGAACFPTRLKP